MKIIISKSALRPSQYREYVKGWDKSRYERAFHYYTGTPDAYRIYLPLEGDLTEIEIPKDILAAINESGCKVEDYVNGVAVDSHNRKRKIGTLIKNPILRQRFANDPQRAASKEPMQVVISRHPYDIAGMSTGRGWTSCMNIDRGDNRKYVPSDIEAGTLIAYLVSTKDPDIKNPTARVLLKPYMAKEGGWGGDRRALIPSLVYGTAPRAFLQTVGKWCADYNMRYQRIQVGESIKLNKNLYQDNIDLFTKVPDLTDDNSLAPYIAKMIYGQIGRAYHTADVQGGLSMFQSLVFKPKDWQSLMKDISRMRYPTVQYPLTLMALNPKCAAFLKKNGSTDTFVDNYLDYLVVIDEESRPDKYLSFSQLVSVIPKKQLDAAISDISVPALDHYRQRIAELDKYCEDHNL